MKSRILYFVVTLAVMLSIVACAGQENNNNKPLLFSQENKVSFEDLIKNSNVAIIGEYIDTTDYEEYSEARFKVKECLYGDVRDEEIYLFLTHAVSYVREIDYKYDHNDRQYKEGKEYILVMEKGESIMYDHDRYAIQSDLFLSEEDNEFTLYSKPITIPEHMDIKEYICSVYSSVSHEEADMTVQKDYDDLIKGLVEESKIIAVVKVNRLETEGRLHNGNTYRCEIEELINQAEVNTYNDGTILVVIEKGLVETGNKYIIGFNPVEEKSLIYMQSIRNGVWPEDSGAIGKIKDEIESIKQE
ncbi:MAG: hypothetical protein IJL07_04975 [Lachnospiraceae bacterium]|nr:hypothetical protein [Lachnospiraceae bacterium]